MPSSHRRVGFDIVRLGDGERKRLARTGANTGHKVGQYGVFVSDFEAVALPILSSVVPGDVVIIDEIGTDSTPPVVGDCCASISSFQNLLFRKDGALQSQIHRRGGLLV